MQFDVIPITETEVGKLAPSQLRLLRDAQQKKNELLRDSKKELNEFRLSVMNAGMAYSSLVESKEKELSEETEYQCSVIADNLLFDMSVIGQTTEGSGESSDGSQVEYKVDYALSYSERYVIVRDYYLKITDMTERLTRYAADETAKKYLGSYYKTLYNVLATYER